MQESGDAYWTYTHNNLARNDAIRNIEQTKYEIIKESNLKNPLEDDFRVRELSNQTLLSGLKRPMNQRVKNFQQVLEQGV
jgi:hypothetical protein